MGKESSKVVSGDRISGIYDFLVLIHEVIFSFRSYLFFIGQILISEIGWKTQQCSEVGALYAWEMWIYESVSCNLIVYGLIKSAWYAPFHWGWRASLSRCLFL